MTNEKTSMNSVHAEKTENRNDSGYRPGQLLKHADGSHRALGVIMLCLAGLAGCSTIDANRPSEFKASGNAKVVSPTTATQKTADVNSPKPQRQVSINGMTLSDAVSVAIARHPDISRQKAIIANSSSEVAIAKAAWYPTFEYSVRPGYGSSDNNTDRSGAHGSVGINQLLYDFGRTKSRILAADAMLVGQKHLQNDTIETVAYDTATTFIHLSASQDIIVAAQKQVAALKETRDKIAERVNAGLSDASDLNQADVATQRAEADALKAQTEFDVAAGQLAELVGSRPERVATLSGTSTFVSRLGTASTDIEQTPAVLAANSALKAADARVELARAEQYPSLNAGVSRTLSTSGWDDNDSTYIGISLNGSFSFGGLTRHQIEAAEADKVAAQQTLENRRLVTRTALGSAQTEAAGAAARLASYDTVIRLSRSSRDLYWQEYTLNKRPLTDVISAEREIYSSEIERINALADGVKAKIKAQSSIGQFVVLLSEDGKDLQ